MRAVVGLCVVTWCVGLALWAAPAAAEWRAEIVPTSGRVRAVEMDGASVRVAIGDTWWGLTGGGTGLVASMAPLRTAVPEGGLPDGRVATSDGPIARAWLAMPTPRYHHGVLGDAIEAGSMAFVRRDGRAGAVVLGEDAVFEDLSPRIARLGDRDRIVVVKSYLARGSALAVVDVEAGAVIAETPPIGHANAWINPAGIADFDGRGLSQIAVVRQPHVVGVLELWSWSGGRLIKAAEVPDVANHVIGSRMLAMAWTADFDGDGYPDLAVPSLDRRTLRLLAFAPKVRDIARVPLPARVVTNIGGVVLAGKTALVLGMEDGRLVVVRER